MDLASNVGRFPFINSYITWCAMPWALSFFIYYIFIYPIVYRWLYEWTFIKDGEYDGSLYKNNPRFVDLGLPSGLLWADRNIGANDPDLYGVHFAWGEISPKISYKRKNYTWTDSKLNNSTLTSKCDVASVRWKRGARMPRVEEFEELLSKCTWKEINEAVEYDVDGCATVGYDTVGYKVIGRNGNSIFLPTCGFYIGFSRENASQREGAYWTATLRDETHAYGLELQGSRAAVRNFYIGSLDDSDAEVCIDLEKGLFCSEDEVSFSVYFGLSVRAVKDPRKKRSKPEGDA